MVENARKEIDSLEIVFKGTVMHIEKAPINDHLRVSNVS